MEEAVEELFEEAVLSLISKNLIFEIPFYIYFMKKMNAFAFIFESICLPKKCGILIKQGQEPRFSSKPSMQIQALAHQHLPPNQRQK